MATIRVETLIKYTDLSGAPVTLPFVASPGSTFLTVEKRDVTLATATRKIIWDAVNQTSDTPSGFAFLALISQGSLMDVEFVADVANGTTFRAPWTQRLISGLPLMLGADDTYVGASNSDKFAAGTLNKINQISLQNNSGASRTVTMIIGSLVAAV